MTTTRDAAEAQALLTLHALLGPVVVLGDVGAPPMAQCPACGTPTPVGHDGHCAYCLPCTRADEHRRLTTKRPAHRPAAGRSLRARGLGDARRAWTGNRTGTYID